MKVNTFEIFNNPPQNFVSLIKNFRVIYTEFLKCCLLKIKKQCEMVLNWGHKTP